MNLLYKYHKLSNHEFIYFTKCVCYVVVFFSSCCYYENIQPNYGRNINYNTKKYLAMMSNDHIDRSQFLSLYVGIGTLHCLFTENSH